MTTTVDPNLLTYLDDFRAEASTEQIGWEPGFWPMKIVTPGLGNNNPFYRQRTADGREGFVYVQAQGLLSVEIYVKGT
jgi:hypothetical protein